jgi:hypothetical protein
MQITNLYFVKSGNRLIKRTERPTDEVEYIEKLQLVAEEGKKLKKGELVLKKTTCNPADLELWTEIDEEA